VKVRPRFFKEKIMRWIAFVILVFSGCASTPPLRQTIKVDVQMHMSELKEATGDATVGVAYFGVW
jgi:predicted component of type VI protein secretion system